MSYRRQLIELDEKRLDCLGDPAAATSGRSQAASRESSCFLLRDAPINLPRSDGGPYFARQSALCPENGLTQRAAEHFPLGFPC